MSTKLRLDQPSSSWNDSGWMLAMSSSHAFFWMFLPFRATAVLTKFGERNNESPAYVANTADVGAKSGA